MPVILETIKFLGYHTLMHEMAHQTNMAENKPMKGFFKSHGLAIALFSMTLLALPAYLSAMEGQFIDMEFLASLCGIAGWGS